MKHKDLAREGSVAAAPKRVRRAYLPAAERRKLIIAAAQEVFARENLKGAKTRDIARLADINQATIFEHFDSKEALFQAAVVQPLLAAMRGMEARRETYEQAASPDELAELGLAAATRHISDMVDIFPLFTAALFSDPDLGRQLYREHIAPLLRRRGGIMEGLVRDGLDLDFVGLANFGIIFAIALDWHFGEQGEGKQTDLPKMAKQCTRMATGGFARNRTARVKADSKNRNSGE